jgi:hypothetical protein
MSMANPFVALGGAPAQTTWRSIQDNWREDQKLPGELARNQAVTESARAQTAVSEQTLNRMKMENEEKQKEAEFMKGGWNMPTDPVWNEMLPEDSQKMQEQLYKSGFIPREGATQAHRSKILDMVGKNPMMMRQLTESVIRKRQSDYDTVKEQYDKLQEQKLMKGEVDPKKAAEVEQAMTQAARALDLAVGQGSTAVKKVEGQQQITRMLSVPGMREALLKAPDAIRMGIYQAWSSGDAGMATTILKEWDTERQKVSPEATRMRDYSRDLEAEKESIRERVGGVTKPNGEPQFGEEEITRLAKEKVDKWYLKADKEGAEKGLVKTDVTDKNGNVRIRWNHPVTGELVKEEVLKGAGKIPEGKGPSDFDKKWKYAEKIAKEKSGDKTPTTKDVADSYREAFGAESLWGYVFGNKENTESKPAPKF